MLDREQLTSLQHAATVVDIANSAISDQERMQVAYAINYAANTGQQSILYNGRLSSLMQTLLEGQGYHVRPNADGADPTSQWIISAKEV